MKRIREKLASWEHGRQLMEDVSVKYDTEIEEITDGNLKIETDTFTITCHFDPREFSFILAKMRDEDLISVIKSLIDEYPKYSP